MSAAPLTSTSAQPGSRGRRRYLLELVFVLLCSLAAVLSVVLIEGHHGKAIEIIPIGLIAAAGMVILALTDFTTFAIAVLAIRATLDWSKSAPAHVGGAGASSGNAASALAILFLGASFVWFLGRRRYLTTHPEAVKKWRSDLAPALLFFLFAGFLSVFGSARIGTSGLEFLRIASAVTMLLVLERVMVSRKVIKRVLAACICASLVPGLVAVSELAGGGGLFTSGGYSRIRGTFVHPNPYAIFLTFILIMSFALFFQTSRRLRPWLAVLTLGNCAALLLTYTRTGWVATSVGVFVLCLVNKKLKYFFGAALVGLIVLSPVIYGRVEDLSTLQRSNGTAGNSLIWRFSYWTQILPLANHNPITGIGLKMVQFNAIEQKEPHNDFIRAYVETGLIGFIAYVNLQVCMWRTAIRGLRATVHRGGFDRAVAAGFMGAVVAFTMISVVSNVISSSVLLWYLFAFAAASGVIARMPPEGTPEVSDDVIDPTQGALLS